MNRNSRHIPNTAPSFGDRWGQSQRGFGFGSRMRGPVVEEAVDFNPTWMNEQGLMTNVPGPSFLSSIEFKRPYMPSAMRRAIGFYVADRSKDLLNGFTNDAQGDLLLKFSISDNAIHQELSGERKAIIRSDFSVRIIDTKTDRLSEIWEAHRRIVNPINPAEGFKVEWARTSHWTTVQDKPQSTLMPGWYGDLFTRLTLVFERFLRDIGYAEELDKDREENEDDPFFWVYELTQQDSDARYGENEGRTTPPAWINVPTDYAAYKLWGDVLTTVNSWRALLASSRFGGQSRHRELFANIQAYIAAAIKLRDDAYQRQESEIMAAAQLARWTLPASPERK